MKLWVQLIKNLRKQTHCFTTPVPKKIKIVEENKIRRKLRSKTSKAIVKEGSSATSKLASDETYSLCGKKRKRKNSDQVKILIDCYNQNPRWDKAAVDRAVRKSGLSRAQVYKWGWDRKKKAQPTDIGFIKTSKDEFGGYSKHDFVEDVDPIAQLLDIDLNKEIEKLCLSLDNQEPIDKHESRNSGTSINHNLVEQKKRDSKAKRKKELEVKLSPVKSESLQSPVLKTLMKDAQVQTPNPCKEMNEAFITPVKVWRDILAESGKHFENMKPINFNVFEDEDGPSNLKSEWRRDRSSGNSKSKSAIKTSQLRCSESLLSKKVIVQNENVGLGIRYIFIFNSL